MNKRDIVVGLIILVLAFVLFNRINEIQNSPEPIAEDTSQPSFKEDIEKVLGIEIDETQEKLEISTGANRAIITRDDDFEINILADLETLEEGQIYQAWSIEEDNHKLLGDLQNQKGGFILQVPQGENIKKILISRESIQDDNIENRVLEGSF